MSPSPDYELLDRCNETELLQILKRLGIAVPVGLPKETLINVLLGEEEPDAAWANVMDSWRHGIMGFLLDHWEVVRSQLECPAKSGDPRSCFNCIDAQVISCITQNPGDEHLIQLKRKNEP